VDNLWELVDNMHTPKIVHQFYKENPTTVRSKKLRQDSVHEGGTNST